MRALAAAILFALGLGALALNAEAQFVGGTLWRSAGAPVAGIGFDSLGGNSISGGTSSVSWSHTVAGPNPFLVSWGFCYRSTAPPAVLTWTYNGVAMTLLDSSLVTAANGNQVSVREYYMAAPPTGTHTLAITLSSGCSTAGFFSSASYSGAHQTTPIDAHAIPTDPVGSASQAATVTVGTANSWLVGAAGMNSPSTQTIVAGAGTTSRYSDDVSTTLARMLADSGGPVQTGSRSLNYSTSSGSLIWFGLPVLSLKPAP